VSHDDFDTEPVPGLPALPPEGEDILWQGSPDWRTLAHRVLHVGKVAVYFALLVTWQIVSGSSAGHGAEQIATSVGICVLLAACSIGILVLIARAISRTTVYTITSRRVVMRFGVALPITYNLPFRMIAGAGLREFANSTGDLPIELLPGNRLAYLVLWPHVRPWRLSAPQPMLRVVPEAKNVATTLANALAAHSVLTAPQPSVQTSATTTVRIPSSTSLTPSSAGKPQLVAAE